MSSALAAAQWPGAAEIDFKAAQEQGAQEVLQAYRAGYGAAVVVAAAGVERGGGSGMMRISGV